MGAGREAGPEGSGSRNGQEALKRTFPGSKPGEAVEPSSRTGGGSSRQGDEAAGRGALTLEWRLGNGQPFEASERPSKVSSPGLIGAGGAPGRDEAGADESGDRGAERRSARRIRLTELGAGHAGGERCWESGHLEPFSFGGRLTLILGALDCNPSGLSRFPRSQAFRARAGKPGA